MASPTKSSDIDKVVQSELSEEAQNKIDSYQENIISNIKRYIDNAKCDISYTAETKHNKLGVNVKINFSSCFLNFDSAYKLVISISKQTQIHTSDCECHDCDNFEPNNRYHCTDCGQRGCAKCCIESITYYSEEISYLYDQLKTIQDIFTRCDICNQAVSKIKQHQYIKSDDHDMGTSITQMENGEYVCRNCINCCALTPDEFFECEICASIRNNTDLHVFKGEGAKHSDKICKPCYTSSYNADKACPLCRADHENENED